MGKVLFHIGVGKSGTTSLQKNLFDKLKNCANLGCPNDSDDLYQSFFYGIQHAEDLDVESYVGPFVKKVEEMSKQYPLIIISDEGLQGTKVYTYSYIISRLKTFFPGSEMLVTVRNQLTAIQSYYSQDGYRLKQVPAADEFNRKKFISFNEYLEYAMGAHDSTYLHYLKYKRLLRVIEQYFSKEKIHVLLFEEMAKQPEVFLGRMAKILGYKCDELLTIWHQEAPKNARQSANSLAYQKLRTRIPFKSIRRVLPGVKYLLPKIEQLLKKGKAPLSPEYSQQQVERLKCIYAKENAYLQKEYDLDLNKWGYLLQEDGIE